MMKFFYVLLGLNAIVSFVVTIWIFREEKETPWIVKIVLFPFMWFFSQPTTLMFAAWGVVFGGIIFFESLLGPERFDKLSKAIKEVIASIVFWSIGFMIIGTIVSALRGLVSP